MSSQYNLHRLQKPMNPSFLLREIPDCHSTWTLVSPTLRKGPAALPYLLPTSRPMTHSSRPGQSRLIFRAGTTTTWCGLLHIQPQGSLSLLHSVRAASRDLPSAPRQKEAALTSEVSDEGHGLDGVATVGEGLDDVVLHDAQHAEASLVTCGHGQVVVVRRELPGELTTWPPARQRQQEPDSPAQAPTPPAAPGTRSLHSCGLGCNPARGV